MRPISNPDMDLPRVHDDQNHGSKWANLVRPSFQFHGQIVGFIMGTTIELSEVDKQECGLRKAI